jgi:hypothetical protein
MRVRGRERRDEKVERRFKGRKREGTKRGRIRKRINCRRGWRTGPGRRQA